MDGICQISSTIFNAVEKVAGIDITERHNHSKNVYYVPRGREAAVCYGSLDFKFKNKNNFAIKLYIDVNTEEVTCRVVKLI